MKAAGYTFLIRPTDVPEHQPRGLTPSQLVSHLALKKALAAAKKFPHDVIVGADTLVFIGKKVIGKPRHPKHAAQILRRLSGAWQRVYTGVALVRNGGKIRRTRSAVSYVKFRRLSEREIADASTRHLDKAGAYAVQHKKDKFVERIKGDYDNVVGLPMRVVKKLLRGAI
jgi:septum formation protein